MRIRGTLSLVLVAALAAVAWPAIGADDYSDPAYAEHDVDNMTRSMRRQGEEFSDPAYYLPFLQHMPSSWLDRQGRQVADLVAGRIRLTLGQTLPGGGVGNPRTYRKLTPTPVAFLARTGAKLEGHVWGLEGPGPKPGVVITTGSIQGPASAYWWAAETLAEAGYVVLTFDVQGQGFSETFGHEFGSPAPTQEGFPFQQSANFVDGTVDALRFFLSTPAAEYRPLPRTPDEVAAAKAAAQANHEHLDWVNPAWGILDRTRVGIAGHSAGGGAVSQVQQCSDAGALWRTLEVCQGTSFPIRAVVGWDSLSSGVTPVVPGMNQQADGYFFNPTPTQEAPDPDAHLAAHQKWVEAGIDTYSVTVRGGTHVEWSVIPYLLPSTTYGPTLAAYYTLFWMDRFVKGDRAASARLLDGPRDGVNSERAEAAMWNAHHLSTRYRSAYRLDGRTVVDLRAAAGLSPVGDWAGSNADRVGRVAP